MNPSTIKYLAKIGAKGGQSRSKAKADAARKNAKLGGRPKAKCEQGLTGYVSYWNRDNDHRCGNVARYEWLSSLRGGMKLCTRHAKAVGLKNCKPLKAREKRRKARSELP